MALEQRPHGTVASERDRPGRVMAVEYGRDGIDDMRAVKRTLDPDFKLAPGVLFGER